MVPLRVDFIGPPTLLLVNRRREEQMNFLLIKEICFTLDTKGNWVDEEQNKVDTTIDQMEHPICHNNSDEHKYYIVHKKPFHCLHHRQLKDKYHRQLHRFHKIFVSNQNESIQQSKIRESEFHSQIHLRSINVDLFNKTNHDEKTVESIIDTYSEFSFVDSIHQGI